MRKKAPRLPSEYQEVEYIQSSGTQYIDTGVSANQYLSYEAKLTALGTTNDSPLFGARTGSASNRFGLIVYGGNFHMMIGSTSAESFNNTPVDTNSHTCSVFINNGSYTATMDGNTSTGSTSTAAYVNQNFWLFKYNYGSVAPCPMKLYYFKLYTGSSTLVRDFVPCYRKSDSVVGMYDLVNNQFYTNSGSGSFTKGTDSSTIELKEFQVWPDGGTLSGYWDFTTTTQAALEGEGWAGQGGGSWSVSSSGLTTSRSTTDRSYMVSLPIQISTEAKSIRIYGVINRTVGSWYGSFQWGIKATNTCGTRRDDVPVDDWLITQTVNCNNNSGYMGYGAGSSASVLNCGLPGWNANLGYSGSDLAVEAIIDIKNGEISATWKSGSTTIQSGTNTFDSATVKAALSGLSTNQYLSIFNRNGTGNYKYMKNFGYEIIY